MTHQEIFVTYSLPVIVAALTAFAGFIGTQVKKLYEKYINDNIAWDLSIEHLCAHFSISRAELYQLFHTNFNASVADYIRSKRIDMAEQLIRTTSMQISEIAANVGFFDYNYFSKVFHRKFGVSPREYRKKLEDNGTGQEKTAEQGKSNTKKA